MTLEKYFPFNGYTEYFCAFKLYRLFSTHQAIIMDHQNYQLLDTLLIAQLAVTQPGSVVFHRLKIIQKDSRLQPYSRVILQYHWGLKQGPGGHGPVCKPPYGLHTNVGFIQLSCEQNVSSSLISATILHLFFICYCCISPSPIILSGSRKGQFNLLCFCFCFLFFFFNFHFGGRGSFLQN